MAPQEGLEPGDPLRLLRQRRVPLGHEPGERLGTGLVMAQRSDLLHHRREAPVRGAAHRCELPRVTVTVGFRGRDETRDAALERP
jgi:hypothetical protein